MEILNNIWSALTTENEMLMSLILIPFNLIENYISLTLFSTILKIECNKIQKLIYIICTSIIGILTANLIPAPINTFINYIFLFFIIYKLFKLPLIKTILSMIIPFCAFAIVGTLILNPITKLFKIEDFVSDMIPLHRIVYLCIVYFLISIILVFLKLKDTKIELLDDLNHHNKNIIIVNLLLGIFTLAIQLVITIFYTGILPVFITFLSSISLFFYFLISVYSLNHIMKLQKATTDLENAENYNNTLSILYDNVKGFKHDFDNIVHMLGGYIKTNDMDGLTKYYSELEADCERVKSIAALNPNLINNPGIYNLLVTKYKKANDLNIKINFEYFFDFEKLNMPIYQFSRMFGILLDNAIEAAPTCEEKEINIIFRDSQSAKTQIVIIENTYSNKNIDTKKIFEIGVSEKENHSGMGLWEVKQILMKNNNIKLITTNDNKYFKQQLEIYY